jgi:hypothetical protein
MHLALKGLRPRQWTENVVLFAGLVFSITATNQGMVVGVIAASTLVTYTLCTLLPASVLASGNLKLASRAGEPGIGFVAVAGSVIYF